jgi:phosphoribosyl-AMP cyclohydrolase
VTAELEEGLRQQLDFGKLEKIGGSGHQVVPAVVQDVDSGEVLLVGYANAEALKATLDRGRAVFWSTSRDELWEKGATSGDALSLVEVRVNCEQNSLLYRVRITGQGSCHTKGEDGRYRRSCYYRTLTSFDDLEFS